MGILGGVNSDQFCLRRMTPKVNKAISAERMIKPHSESVGMLATVGCGARLTAAVALEQTSVPVKMPVAA